MNSTKPLTKPDAKVPAGTSTKAWRNDWCPTCDKHIDKCIGHPPHDGQ